MTPQTASEIAVSGLQYLAGDSEQLSRFVALTGIDPEAIREQAGSSAFLAAVLDFLLGHEPTLLAFAEGHDINPDDVQKARFTLDPPGENEGW